MIRTRTKIHTFRNAKQKDSKKTLASISGDSSLTWRSDGMLFFLQLEVILVFLVVVCAIKLKIMGGNV